MRILFILYLVTSVPDEHRLSVHHGSKILSSWGLINTKVFSYVMVPGNRGFCFISAEEKGRLCSLMFLFLLELDLIVLNRLPRNKQIKKHRKSAWTASRVLGIDRSLLPGGSRRNTP
jgi:hypothetical protein